MQRTRLTRRLRSRGRQRILNLQVGFLGTCRRLEPALVMRRLHLRADSLHEEASLVDVTSGGHACRRLA